VAYDAQTSANGSLYWDDGDSIGQLQFFSD